MDTNTAEEAALESVERDAWLDFYAAAPAPAARDLRLHHHRIGALGLLASRGIAIIEMNRALGFGIGGGASAAQIDEAARWLRTHAYEGWALQIAQAEPVPAPSGGEALAPAGAGWAKFRRDAAPEPGPAASALEVRPADAATAAVFGQVVQTGFGFPPAAAAWFAALVGRPGWGTYVAFERGEPAAAGATFVQGAAAWLGMDTTLDPYRGRGAQGALIARRVRDGSELGASRFTAETAYPEDDGAPSASSFRNYRRAGFRLAYRRMNYTPRPPRAP